MIGSIILPSSSIEYPSKKRFPGLVNIGAWVVVVILKRSETSTFVELLTFMDRMSLGWSRYIDLLFSISFACDSEKESS
jgi:hypothetical protein